MEHCGAVWNGVCSGRVASCGRRRTRGRACNRRWTLRPTSCCWGATLPEADSLDVCRQIRSRLQPEQAPLFLLTPGGLLLAEDAPGGHTSANGSGRTVWTAAWKRC